MFQFRNIYWTITVLFCLSKTSGFTISPREQDHEGEEERTQRLPMENTGSDIEEGDMKLYRPSLPDSQGRAHDTVPNMVWPNGVLPYVLHSSLSSKATKVINEAIKHIEDRTCIKLVPRKQEHNYVLFFKGQGCWSWIGQTQLGKQELSIGAGCERMGIVVHEILHTLGFVHEHSRQDRDTYVKILLENVRKGHEKSFRIKNYSSSLDEPYDYGSIMHYPRFAFTKNGLPTIETKDPSASRLIGQRRALSVIDIRQIRKMYGCPSPTQAVSTTEVSFSTKEVTPTSGKIETTTQKSKTSTTGSSLKISNTLPPKQNSSVRLLGSLLLHMVAVIAVLTCR